jgi:hypothetical protein
LEVRVEFLLEYPPCRECQPPDTLLKSALRAAKDPKFAFMASRSGVPASCLKALILFLDDFLWFKLRRHSKSDRLLERMPKEISNWLAKSAADTAVRPAGCVSKLRDGTPRKYTCDAYGPLRLENACAFSCGAYSAEISSVFPRTSRYVRLRIFLVSGSSVSTRICLSIHWPPIF